MVPAFPLNGGQGIKLLSGQPVLSGHLAASKGWQFNRSLTVLLQVCAMLKTLCISSSIQTLLGNLKKQQSLLKSIQTLRAMLVHKSKFAKLGRKFVLELL